MPLDRHSFQKLLGRMLQTTPCFCRCVREDEVSATVRCHYLCNGMVNFTFVIRRREFFVPAGAILKCFIDATDREIFEYLAASVPAVRFSFSCWLPHISWLSCMLCIKGRVFMKA